MRHAGPHTRLALMCLGLAALAISACDDDDPDKGEAERAHGPPQNVATRDCEAEGASASGGRHLDLDSGQNVRAGPLIFYFAGEYADSPASEFAPVRSLPSAPPRVQEEIRVRRYYRALKLLLVFRGTRAVTIEVPEAVSSQASLLYAATRGRRALAERLGLARVADGRRAVRFVPCRGPGRFSEFPGGLVMAGARCLPLEVWVAGTEKPIRRALSFGAGDRCESV